MKHTEGLRAAERSAMSWMALSLLMAMAILMTIGVRAQSVSTTTVQGTVYLADGRAGSGTLMVRWPAFTTADGQAVAASSMTAAISADGFVSVKLAPNQGATPAGLYYTVVLYLSDGSTSTEYWVVPAAATATLAQVRSQVMPAAQAVQAVSKAYVDQAVSQISQSQITASGGNMSGPLYLNADPTQASQAADKHYVDSQLATTLPLAGGSLSGSLSGTNATFSGKVNAAAINGNVNTVFAVTTYGAVGDCTVSGPVGSCTDNSSAIQAAVNAAYSAHGKVYFPNNASGTGTVYYMGDTVNPKGVSFEGPNGYQDGNSTAVAVRGAAGKDIFATGEQSSGNYVVPMKTFTVSNLLLLVDDSIDASASFPTRFPGRTVYDGAMAHGSAVLTSAHNRFQQGDVGQAIRVYGAGAAGVNLDTTIASWQSPTQVTLTDAASTDVSNAHVYTSLAFLPVTQTVGNCAFAYDANNSTAGYVAAGSPQSVRFDHVVVNAVHGSYNNSTCGFFFQGPDAPYASSWRDSMVTATFPFVFVPAHGASANMNAQSEGIADYNVFDHLWVFGKYPWISYGGNENSITNTQLYWTEQGPHILAAAGAYSAPGEWHIDIPEEEGGCSTGSTTTLPYRLFGRSYMIDRFQTLHCAGHGLTSNVWLDVSDSNFRNVNWDSQVLTITGNNNKLSVGMDLNQRLTTYNITGLGNTVEWLDSSNPWNGSKFVRPALGYNISAPTVTSPLVSRTSKVYERTHDFIGTGADSYYFNAEDMWIWPDEPKGGTIPVVIQDSTSDTGKAIQTNAVGGASVVLDESAGSYWIIGNRFPTKKIRFTFKARADSGTATWAPMIYSNIGGTLCTLTAMSLTATYSTGSCDADLSASATGNLYIYLTPPTAGSNVDVAWIAARPWDSGTITTSLKVGTGTAITASHGTGGSAQESDGTGSTGNLAKFTSDGSVTNGPASPAGTIVGATDSQTLTNKTLTSPAISSPTITGTPTQTGSGTVSYSITSTSDQAVVDLHATNGAGSVRFFSGSTTVWQLGTYLGGLGGTTFGLFDSATATRPFTIAVGAPTGSFALAASGSVSIPAVTTTTQSANDNSTKVASTAYVATPGAIAPTSVTATGIVTGGNDSTRTTSTTMANAWTTTGLVLPTVPINTTKSGHCTILWQMSSTSYTATFGLGMNNAPTNVWGGARVIYAAGGTSNWLAFTQSSTSTTAISSATTAGATGTTYAAMVDFVVQTGASNSVAMTMYGQTSNSGATLSIMPGSTCYWLP